MVPGVNSTLTQVYLEEDERSELKNSTRTNKKINDKKALILQTLASQSPKCQSEIKRESTREIP